VLILAGLGWAITNSPDRNEMLLVEKATEKFFEKADLLNSSLIKSSPLPEFKETHSLTLEGQTDSQPQIIEIRVDGEVVILTFLESDNELSGQTMIFEPVVNEQQVLWKCLNGSVLLRYRSKHCQLGEAVDGESFKAVF